MGFAFRFVPLPWGKMDVFMADRLNAWPIQPGTGKGHSHSRQQMSLKQLQSECWRRRTSLDACVDVFCAQGPWVSQGFSENSREKAPNSMVINIRLRVTKLKFKGKCLLFRNAHMSNLFDSVGQQVSTV